VVPEDWVVHVGTRSRSGPCRCAAQVLTAPELANQSVSAHAALVLPLLQKASARLRARRALSTRSKFLRDTLASVGDVVGMKRPTLPAAVLRSTPDDGDGPPVHTLRGEGHCHIALQVWQPPPLRAQQQAHASTRHGVAVPRGLHPLRPNSRRGTHLPATRVVLYIGRKDPISGRLSNVERDRIAALQRGGVAVVTADLCGFGPSGGGDAFGSHYGYRSDASTARPRSEERVRQPKVKGAGPGGGATVDVAFNNNRSIVAVHAADLHRLANAVLSDGAASAPRSWGLGPNATIVATICANDTAAAVLVAVLTATRSSTPKPSMFGDIAIVSSFATWAGLSRSARYDQNSYYAWVYGVLQHFDLPDLVAATSLLQPWVPRVLVLSPTDALRTRLPPKQAAKDFEFVLATQPRAVVDTNASTAADIDRVLVQWLNNTQ
jgi:hypothetical protein